MGWQKFHAVQQGEVQSLHLGRSNLMHQYVLVTTCLQSSLAENDVGVLMDPKLCLSQGRVLVAKKVNRIVGCI